MSKDESQSGAVRAVEYMFKRFNVPFEKVGDNGFRMKTPLRNVPKGSTLYVESFSDFKDGEVKGRIFTGYVFDIDKQKSPVELKSVNIDWDAYKEAEKKAEKPVK